MKIFTYETLHNSILIQAKNDEIKKCLRIFLQKKTWQTAYDKLLIDEFFKVFTIINLFKKQLWYSQLIELWT